MKSKYRIMYDGTQYKVQSLCGWWIFKIWRDLGQYLPPFTPASFKVTLYGKRQDAEALIDAKEKYDSKIHKWKDVT